MLNGFIQGLQDKDARHLSCYENIFGRMVLFDFHKPLDPVTTIEIVGDINMDMFDPHGISLAGPHIDGKCHLEGVYDCIPLYPSVMFLIN